MEKESEASTEAFGDTFGAPESSTREEIVTMGRIMNVAISFFCVVTMISCIVCLGVMADKHHDIINNVDPGPDHKYDDKEVCILFTSSEENKVTKDNTTRTEWKIKFNKSHTCQFVIAGSGVVAGLLLMAATYYIARLFIMRR